MIVQGTSVGLDVHALSVVAHAVDEVWDEWVPLSDVLAAVAKSGADVIAGRTFGEDEIRAAYRVPRQPS